MMTKREIITDIAMRDLPGVVESMGLKAYAADQIIDWLYKRRATTFDEMTNVAKEARKRLAERFEISALVHEGELGADDGTCKFLFGLVDGEKIESVLIPADEGRRTLCVSTQAGCAMGCAFCRTARMGFRRNLSQGEIVGQVIEAQRRASAPLTNIVFMGMGEPLMNLEAVCSAIEILLSERAFGFSKRRVTVSTAGLVPELEELSSRLDVKIAISLNATNDKLRDELMPVNRKYPLAALMAFCREYSRRAKHRITFEYVMIGGVNDARADAAALVKLLKGVRAKINLIPFNPFPGSDWSAPTDEAVDWWREYLVGHGIQTNVRVSRGGEILAACGQLAAEQT
jgi:23S rRNA (adenine2503-C2)-methyltransferase